MDYELLHEISEIDRKLIEIKREMEKKDTVQRLALLRQEYNSFKCEYESITQEIESKTRLSESLTSQIESLTKEMKNLERTLYEAKNMKTVSAYEVKIAGLGREIEAKEEEAYSILDAIEELNKQKKDIIRNSREIKIKYDSLKDKYKIRENELNNQRENLLSSRLILMDKISQGSREEYERITKDLGYGMAEVNGEICSGCRMSVPSIIIYKVRENKCLMKCQSCGRYIYLAD
jgi:predicted  nucleic acid-binding Zn-ribbon protein